MINTTERDKLQKVVDEANEVCHELCEQIDKAELAYTHAREALAEFDKSHVYTCSSCKKKIMRSEVQVDIEFGAHGIYKVAVCPYCGVGV